MHTKHLITILAIGVLPLLFMSCSSTKHTVKSTDEAAASSTAFSAEDYVATLSQNYSSVTGLTSKVKVTVDADGKNLSTTGTLKMKKDEIIQLTLIDPILGLMEVGRLEFTPTKVLIVDRINKQYIDVPYAEVSFLKMANVDFNTLQSLFWNEIFVPGKDKADAAAFKFTNLSATDLNMDYQDRMLHYQFTSDQIRHNLKKALINNPSDKRYDFAFTYEGFTALGSRQFPTDLTMQFKASGRSASLALSLNSVKPATESVEPTKPSSKYSKVSADKILKLITQ